MARRLSSLTPFAALAIALIAALAVIGCERSSDAASADRAATDVPTDEPTAPAPTSDATKTEVPTVAPTVTAEQGPPALEDLLKPGDTLVSAQARLGKDKVLAREIAGAEGETLPGWVLYPDDPMRELEVILDEAGTHPVALRVHAPNSAWKRGDGVRIGTTTAELQAMNGRPFKFYGFEWDYGGAITDWNGGTMAAGKTSRGPLTLCPPEATGEPLEDYPSGDAEFSSNDPRIVAHPAVVCEFMVDLGK